MSTDLSLKARASSVSFLAQRNKGAMDQFVNYGAES